MKLLILGGTHFLGRHLVEVAVQNGHTVTLFNRGQSAPELFPEIEQLHGDRDGDLAALQGRHWDAAIDTSGYVPRIVRAAATLLADAVEHYVFISSCSVYADFSQVDIDENAPVIKLEDENTEDFMTPEGYGGLKALCEQVVAASFPEHTLVVRPGLIVGPYDPTDRFTYWPHRVAQGNEILAPAEPTLPVQFIDARDLAQWTIRMVETQESGIYNATGPDYTLTTGQLLAECQQISGSDAHFTWVNEAFLLEHEVEPYSELPLWVPREMQGFSTLNCEKAIQKGLTYRPLVETIEATLVWERTRPAEYELRAGLKPEREQAVLAAWHTLVKQQTTN
jgi:2'-hydroxyisoflavone reductase